MNSEWGWFVVWFVGSAAFVAAFTPPIRSLALRTGLVDHPGGSSYKWHSQPTPHLGGVVIMAGVLLLGVVLVLLRGGPQSKEVAAIMGGSFIAGVTGAWDDLRPLTSLPKLIPVIGAGVLLWVVGIRSTFIGIPSLDFLLTVIWVVGVTHAVNVIDNMDGVATGLSAIAAFGYFVIAASTGQSRVATLALALCGACLGFLPFNVRGATVFLGDAGTLFLGFALASLGLVLDLPSASGISRAAIPLLLLGGPLFNATLVVISRLRRRLPIVRGGTDGTSHRLILLGLSHWQAALVFWGVGAVGAAAAILVSRLPTAAAIVAIGVGSIATIVMVAIFERVYARANPVVPPSSSTPRAPLDPAAVMEGTKSPATDSDLGKPPHSGATA
jgi:UDP-GlcNAc:undecaprenyl-phosphate/decaprenyl-phosphate GlcNAc-1-phosphate transferase